MSKNIQSNIEMARKYCEEKGLRFTEPRQFVLEILLSADRPMGAYDVLKALGQYISDPKPPTAYRAIDFWREHDFVHKVESLNAYVACCDNHDNHVHHDHSTHFLVCDDCSSVTELHMHEKPKKDFPTGFVAKRTFTETHGICATCVNQD